MGCGRDRLAKGLFSAHSEAVLGPLIVLPGTLVTGLGE